MADFPDHVVVAQARAKLPRAAAHPRDEIVVLQARHPVEPTARGLKATMRFAYVRFRKEPHVDPQTGRPVEWRFVRIDESPAP